MEQVAGDISTLHLIRTAWPIVVTLAGSLFALAGVFFMARQTREDFKDFKTREYAGDKGALLAAINDVKENQKQSERKLEEKLDKMDSRNATQQGKVFDELSRISILLARMEGRLYPSASGHNKSEN